MASGSSSSSLPAGPAPSVSYHCACQFTDPVLPIPDRPSASSSYHDLHSLYFCEECDAIKCERCVSTEISCYFCPHCLFEVPNASVRAELNRCARNCFNCPLCTNTLSVQALDDLNSEGSSRPPDEPSYFLACNFCHWSSIESGLTFEKPTGIALQLQKMDDLSAPTLEFDRLREQYEPLLRPQTNAALSTHGRTHVSSSIAAASSALKRNVPSLRTKPRYSAGRPVEPPEPSGDGDELKPYRARGEARIEAGITTPACLGEDDSVDWLSQVEDLDGVADLDSRWTSSWHQSIRARDLRPTRVHLQSKKTKRCMDCKHILIKPEQKAQSVRFKIKLLAATYVPTVEISRRMPSVTASAAMRRDRSSRMSTIGGRAGEGVAATLAAADSDGLVRGMSYTYHLAFINPLFDLIQIDLEILHPVPSSAPSTPATTPAALESEPAETAIYQFPFIASFPITSFSVGAFVDAWEYDDGEDDIDALLEGTAAEEHGPTGSTRRKSGVGSSRRGGAGSYIERKGNCTKVGMDLQVGKEAVGDLNFTLRVSFTYKADEGAEGGVEQGKDTAETEEGAGLKTFVFDTKVFLGRVEL